MGVRSCGDLRQEMGGNALQPSPATDHTPACVADPVGEAVWEGKTWYDDVGSVRANNHLNEGISEADFVRSRSARDATRARPMRGLPYHPLERAWSALPGPGQGNVLARSVHKQRTNQWLGIPRKSAQCLSHLVSQTLFQRLNPQPWPNPHPHPTKH